MNVEKVLADLRDYRTRLDECIGVFDRLARQRGEKRGRPIAVPAAPGGKVVRIQSVKDATRSTKKR